MTSPVTNIPKSARKEKKNNSVINAFYIFKSQSLFCEMTINPNVLQPVGHGPHGEKGSFVDNLTVTRTIRLLKVLLILMPILV